jgi:hypothetical protein
MAGWPARAWRVARGAAPGDLGTAETLQNPRQSPANRMMVASVPSPSPQDERRCRLKLIS